MLWIREYDKRCFRGDLFGGLTAAIVALPLALAFGVSSGAGALAGLYGAICVGLFAACFGGTKTQVSGPTGPMTVVMAAVFTQFNGLDPQQGPAIAFTVVMLAGIFQVLFGLFRLGRYLTLVPFPVISGFMSGIGVIIILLQLAPLLGASPEASVISAVKALPQQLENLNLAACLIGLGALCIVSFTPKSLTQWCPSPLLALLLCTPVAVLLLPVGSVDVIGKIPTGLPEFVLPVFSLGLIQEMVLAALMLAALGTIDSLLTSLVADSLTKTQHDSDRELIGQGVGNLVAGFVAGLPGAGATMRTVVNIRAGGKTPLSGITHALILLFIVLGAAPLAEMIPLAVLAGILLKVGIDIIDWDFLRRLHRAPVFVVFLMLLVFGITVFGDLVTAVVVGVFLANVVTVKRLSDHQLASMRIVTNNLDNASQLSPSEREILHSAHGRILLYQIDGPISYAAVQGMREKLNGNHCYQLLLFDLSQVPLIDVSTAIALESMMLEAHREGREVFLVGINETVGQMLRRMQILKHLPEDAHFNDRSQALEQAYQRLT